MNKAKKVICHVCKQNNGKNSVIECCGRCGADLVEKDEVLIKSAFVDIIQKTTLSPWNCDLLLTNKRLFFDIVNGGDLSLEWAKNMGFTTAAMLANSTVFSILHDEIKEFELGKANSRFWKKESLIHTKAGQIIVVIVKKRDEWKAAVEQFITE